MIKRSEFTTRTQLAEKIKEIFQEVESCEPSPYNSLKNDGFDDWEYYLYYDPDSGDIFEGSCEAREAYADEPYISYLDFRFQAICCITHSDDDFDIYRWEKEGDRDYEEFLSAIDDIVGQWEKEFGKLPEE